MDTLTEQSAFDAWMAAADVDHDCFMVASDMLQEHVKEATDLIQMIRDGKFDTAEYVVALERHDRTRASLDVALNVSRAAAARRDLAFAAWQAWKAHDDSV